jgi:hypothetical protein
MTSAHRTAVVFGDSLFLQGIAAILRSLPGVDVIEWEPEDGDPVFTETQPDIIFLDAAQISFPQMEQLIESFPTQPHPPFVRLDADGQQLTVHSTHNLPAASLTDLAQAIEKICGHVF